MSPIWTSRSNPWKKENELTNSSARYDVMRNLAILAFYVCGI
jgi:hypothetical protein